MTVVGPWCRFRRNRRQLFRFVSPLTRRERRAPLSPERQRLEGDHEIRDVGDHRGQTILQRVARPSFPDDGRERGEPILDRGAGGRRRRRFRFSFARGQHATDGGGSGRRIESCFTQGLAGRRDPGVGTRHEDNAQRAGDAEPVVRRAASSCGVPLGSPPSRRQTSCTGSGRSSPDSTAYKAQAPIAKQMFNFHGFSPRLTSHSEQYGSRWVPRMSIVDVGRMRTTSRGTRVESHHRMVTGRTAKNWHPPGATLNSFPMAPQKTPTVPGSVHLGRPHPFEKAG
jgi:hypothetical protein